MPTESPRPLKVFLSHAHADADAVRALYKRLVADGVDAWLDKEKLVPGQDWEREIRKAVREADVVIVCLSKQFNQRGYRQKEVRIALDEADIMPEGEIFIIPAKLEECEILESLNKIQWVDLFKDNGYEKLMRSLSLRADGLEIVLQKEKQDKTENDKIGSAQKDSISTEVDGLDWKYAKKAAIFNSRLGDAFPGLRDVARFNGEEAVNRLMSLLREPLSISHISPFYWLRGYINGHVSKFEKIDSHRVLLNDVDILYVDYIIAVRKFSAQYKNFVYVQTLPEEPTGLYSKEDLSYAKRQFGFSYEKYGVWKEKLISYAEYEDRATIIDGKPVPLHGVQLRTRYTSSYNFIVCNQDHILNNGDVDEPTMKLLDKILDGELSVDDLVNIVEVLPTR